MVSRAVCAGLCFLLAATAAAEDSLLSGRAGELVLGMPFPRVRSLYGDLTHLPPLSAKASGDVDVYVTRVEQPHPYFEGITFGFSDSRLQFFRFEGPGNRVERPRDEWVVELVRECIRQFGTSYDLRVAEAAKHSAFPMQRPTLSEWKAIFEWTQRSQGRVVTLSVPTFETVNTYAEHERRKMLLRSWATGHLMIEAEATRAGSFLLPSEDSSREEGASKRLEQFHEALEERLSATGDGGSRSKTPASRAGEGR